MSNIESMNNYLNSNIPQIQNKRLLLCVSGGMDSVYMYHKLYSLSSKEDFQIGVAHVNYNTSSNSEGAMNLCKELAIKNNHPIYIKQVTLDSGNFEHNARMLRYEFFNSIKNVEKYDFTLTAHHRDDLIETLYMQNVNTDDYSSIPLNQEHNGLLRPLIGVSKKDITSEVEKNNWSYTEDPTNRDMKYKRNRVRHEILPGLKNRKDVEDKLLDEYKRKIDKYNAFMKDFNDNRNRIITRVDVGVKIDRDYLKKTNLYSLKLIIQGELRDQNNLFPTKSEKFWKEIQSIIISKKMRALKEIDSNTFLYIDPSFVTISSKDSSDECKRLENKTNWMEYTFYIEKVNASINLSLNDKNVFLCPEKMLKSGLYVRKRQNGDKYSFKDKMSKNISDLLNEHKVPLSKRENFPLIISEDKIEWIPGIAHASNNYLDSNDLIKVTAVK